jgi:acyl carrier protein
MTTDAPHSAAALADWLVAAIAQVLDVSPDAIDVERPFSYYGLGSVEAVMIIGDLEALLGCEFPEDLVFDYPSVATLAGHVARHRDAYRRQEAQA